MKGLVRDARHNLSRFKLTVLSNIYFHRRGRKQYSHLTSDFLLKEDFKQPNRFINKILFALI